MGRLGNNLFQIAYSTSTAIDNNMQFFLSSSNKSITKYKTNILKNILFLDIDTSSFKRVGVPFSYQKLNIPKNTNIFMSGFGQTEKYFKHNKFQIINMFSPTPEFIDKYKGFKKQNITAIHVRRGDYLSYVNHHPTVSLEYIVSCAKQIPSEKYIIASDDIDWCKKKIQLDTECQFVENNDWETLWILSMCKNFILSNSTFSWWSAYLANTDGVVFIPSSWFGSEYSYLDTKDIACDNWISVPTTIVDGKIYPT
jgi:hypothetical protein